MIYLVTHKEPYELQKDGFDLQIGDNINISGAFSSVLRKMVQVDLKKRYKRIPELKRDLVKIRENKPVSLTRIALAAVGFVLGIVAFNSYHFNKIEPKDNIIAGKPINTSAVDYKVKANLLYNGESITKLSGLTPEFHLYKGFLSKEVTNVFKYNNGELVIENLAPGDYSLETALDAEKEGPAGYPGDFVNWKSFTAGENPVYMDIDLQKLIHLEKPMDNGKFLLKNERIPFADPLLFKWESLGDNVNYDYGIIKNKTILDDMGKVSSQTSTILGNTTVDTEIKLNLKATEKDETYYFYLYARKNGKRIGLLGTPRDFDRTYKLNFGVREYQDGYHFKLIK
jgi:hypothetical protein